MMTHAYFTMLKPPINILEGAMDVVSSLWLMTSHKKQFNSQRCNSLFIWEQEWLLLDFQTEVLGLICTITRARGPARTSSSWLNSSRWKVVRKSKFLLKKNFWTEFQSDIKKWKNIYANLSRINDYHGTCVLFTLQQHTTKAFRKICQLKIFFFLFVIIL